MGYFIYKCMYSSNVMVQFCKSHDVQYMEQWTCMCPVIRKGNCTILLVYNAL